MKSWKAISQFDQSILRLHICFPSGEKYLQVPCLALGTLRQTNFLKPTKV
jgi:hypothetical protein